MLRPFGTSKERGTTTMAAEARRLGQLDAWRALTAHYLEVRDVHLRALFSKIERAVAATRRLERRRPVSRLLQESRGR